MLVTANFVRAPRLCGASLMVALLTVMTPLHASSQKKKIIYQQRVSAGFDAARVDDTCMVFSASMTADDFFDGLVRTETSKGPEFHKGSLVVKDFPDRLFLELRASVFKCSANPGDIPVPGLATEFMKSLRFQMEWKREFKLRPAKIISALTSRPAWSESDNDWVYELVVEAKDVPLRDHLIVSIFSEDKRITRLSARL